MVKILSALILLYKRLISPLLGPHCRFYPSCSSYFLQALETHGAAKGCCLGIKRMCRCHPLNEGGIDPVPAADCSNNTDLCSAELPNSFTVNKETQPRHGH